MCRGEPDCPPAGSGPTFAGFMVLPARCWSPPDRCASNCAPMDWRRSGHGAGEWICPLSHPWQRRQRYSPISRARSSSMSAGSRSRRISKPSLPMITPAARWSSAMAQRGPSWNAPIPTRDSLARCSARNWPAPMGVPTCSSFPVAPTHSASS